jgi:hypothetical protein
LVVLFPETETWVPMPGVVDLGVLAGELLAGALPEGFLTSPLTCIAAVIVEVGGGGGWSCAGGRGDSAQLLTAGWAGDVEATMAEKCVDGEIKVESGDI